MLDQWINNEWINGSGVSPEITKLAVEPIADRKAIAKFLNWKAYTNDHGGALMRSLDLSAMEVHPIIGQFKPRYPLDLKGDGKTIRYVTPKGIAYDAIAIPLVERWQQVLADASIPVVLTEGVKKAGALETCDYHSLALIGVWNGQLTDKKTQTTLLTPNLAKLAVAGRPFVLAFDADIVRKDGVRQALITLATELKRRGCIIHIAQWSEDDGKGIDDYLVAKGKDALISVINNATQYKDWLNQFKDLEPKAKEAKAKELKPEPLDPFDLELDCTNSTFDYELYLRCFKNGKGNHRVFNERYYEYNEDKGVWQSDEMIDEKVSRVSQNAHIFKGKDREIKVQIGTDRLTESGLRHCAKRLKYINVDLGNKIAFKNGTLNIESNELELHDKENNLTRYIDAEYKQLDTCPPLFQAFLDSSFNKSLHGLIQAVIGMYVDPYCYRKFVHLMGESGSGKGTFISTIASFFDLQNTKTSHGFEELSSPDKRHQHLTNVSFYQLSDLEGYYGGLNAFYDLVEDKAMSGRALRSSSSYEKQWHTKFIAASVDPLQIESSGRGWNRRCIMIPTLPSNKLPDASLDVKIQSEKAEIIAWALSITREERIKILNNPPESSTSVGSDAAMAGDSLKTFVNMCLRPSDTDEEMPQNDLIDMYKEFCLAYGFGKMGLNTFVNRLKSILPKHRIDRKPMYDPDTKTTIQIPAKWVKMEFVPNTCQGSMQDGKRTVVFNKTPCEEGGLHAFEQFDKPSPQQTEMAVAEVVTDNNAIAIGTPVTLEKGRATGLGEVVGIIDSATVEVRWYYKLPKTESQVAIADLRIATGDNLARLEIIKSKLKA